MRRDAQAGDDDKPASSTKHPDTTDMQQRRAGQLGSAIASGAVHTK